MSELIRRSMSASRGDVGLIDRLKADPVTEPSRASRFRELVIDHERALKAGDDIAAAIADNALDRLFDESRAATKEAEPVSNGGRSVAPGATEVTNSGQSAPVPSFDGGARRGRAITRPKKPLTLMECVRAEFEAQQEIRQWALERQEAARR